MIDLLVGVLQLQLKIKLLKVEKRSADVTHTFYLGEFGREGGSCCGTA